MQSRQVHIMHYGTSGPELVLFHGWGFDQKIWHALLPKLLKYGYQVYLVDLPGFGLSSLLDWEQFKEILLAKLPMHFVLLGWSMGGLFATRLALEEPTRVIHLLSVASSPKFVQDDNWPGVPAPVLKAFYMQLCKNPEKTLQTFVQLQMRDQTSHNIVHTPSLTGLKFGLDVLLEWDLREKLHNLAMPASYIFGYKDTITPRLIMSTMQDQYPSFQYKIFENAAHIPFLSHTDQFLEEIMQCINIL